MRALVTIISVVCFLGLQSLDAQNPLAILVAQEKYNECLDTVSEMISLNSNDSTALFYQGVCLLNTGQATKALKSLHLAKSNNFAPSNAIDINRAKCLAQLGQQTKALSILDSLVKEGYASFFPLKDELFNPLIDSLQFQTVKDSVHIRAYPCMYDDRYNHFDFWLGEWDVYIGTFKVGENTITKQEGGCMLIEQYTTARDYVGQSTNFFDPHDGLWKQIWIDKTQGVSKYVESERKPGYLQFITNDKSSPKGTPAYRMTFELQEDGSVTQLIDQQDEDGEWQMVFNGIYRRKD